ncbi:MAG: HEPN domain-containing protein [SAR202 cluster bacterium]|nr:HEPN domain-containing protein [SAR202 cluster bacterium]
MNTPDFLPLEDYGIVLDRYYLSTRYPDVLPAPAIPYQSFSQRDARQALDYAAEIVDLVRAKIPA